MKKIFTWFGHLPQHIAKLWEKEPQIEQTINTVINGIISVGATVNSSQADIIALMFPNGIGTKTLAEVRLLLPEALQVSTIASDAMKAAANVTDPIAKTNAVITTTLLEIGKLPQLAKDAHLLTIIAGIVSKVLHIDMTEATHLVTAKQLEIQQANGGSTTAL